MYTITTAGDVLDEVNGAAPNPVWKRSEVYVGGKHLATVTGTTVVFVHGDWIGTERVRTNMSGVICETTASQPFGDNVQQSGSCNVSPDFLTGKPRDAESNLDDFGARYFSSQWGRWMSADWTAGASAVPYATLTNPQSLNLYAYVGNDPIDGQDPDGHAVYDKGPAGCAAYRSRCSAAGEYGDQASLDFEQLRIDTVAAEWNAAQLARASAQGSPSPAATTPASAKAELSATAQQKKALPSVVVAADPPTSDIKTGINTDREVTYRAHSVNKDGSLGPVVNAGGINLQETILKATPGSNPHTCTPHCEASTPYFEDSQGVGNGQFLDVKREWTLNRRPVPVWDPIQKSPAKSETLHEDYGREPTRGNYQMTYEHPW